MRSVRRPLLAAGLAAAALGASACTTVRTHQGYIIDSDLVNSVQPGVDNRQSVLQTLGHPSFVSQFNPAQANGGDWYYLSRDSRNFAFRNPRAKDQITLRISFNQAGTVAAITRTGAEQIASITPDSKTTPTLGRKRGFFQDLFGNIGTVGAAGAGGGGGSGGGRDTP